MIGIEYKPPISFRYGNDRVVEGEFGPRFRVANQEEEGDSIETLYVHEDGLLQVRLRSRLDPDYGAAEFTAYFENVGDRPTEVLSEIGAEAIFRPPDPTPGRPDAARPPMLRGILGDHGHQYRPYEFLPEGIRFTSSKGRATHTWFPYFQLCGCSPRVPPDDGSSRGQTVKTATSAGQGVMLAIGWPGTWSASFSKEAEGGVRYKASGANGFMAQLLPGEAVRTPLFAFLSYAGDADAGTNAWRRWMLDRNVPTRDPIVVSCFSGDTGRPNSDGSISEGYDTWRRTADKIRDEGLRLDYRWIDAGWYLSPSGEGLDGLSPERDWWRTGSLALDGAKWPGDSLRESCEEMRARGAKTLLWFEPERICLKDPERFERLFGFRREWLLPVREETYLANLGDPECYAWTRDRILGIMGAHGIDLYREDFNCDPADAFRWGDARRAERTGLMSAGMTEIRHVWAHLRIWDEILGFAKSTGRPAFIDSCASGGGRNDLESMRRAIPLMRSDADRTTIALRLSMSSSFLKWIPIHGASCGETAGELDAANDLDAYEARGSCLPVFHCHYEFQNPNVPYEKIRWAISEWERFFPYFDKDFYLLTEWHDKSRTDLWTAWLFYDPDRGEGLLQAFRQEGAPNEIETLRLKGLDPSAMYRVVDWDGIEPERTLSGESLMRGLPIRLPEPRSAAVYSVNKRSVTSG